MPEELTSEYNMDNWNEATKGWSFIMYSPEGYENIPGTVYIQDITFPAERTLSKAGPQSVIPIGENIRDAIRSIAGR